jgi:outer membrane protein
MLALLAGFALAVAPPPTTGGPDCQEQSGCVIATAVQLFALAEELAGRGDLAGAAQILEALTQDKHIDYRSEARFRLARVREKMGDLAGAAEALRDLLAEQPSANVARLELARILSKMGQTKEAQSEVAVAEAWGLPRDVEQNVRKFASALRTTKRRSLTVEFTSGPDTNINRSTSSQFIDTIIAPFELSADARKQVGMGYTFSLNGYSRDRIGPITLLSNAGFHADLSSRPQFNDLQFAADSGPEIALGPARLRPGVTYQRRWFGGNPFSSGVGGKVELLAPLSAAAQVDVVGSRIYQHVAPNAAQDGWQTWITGDVTKAVGNGWVGRVNLRYGALDARAKPESLRQIGGGLLLAHEAKPVTMFGEVDYTHTRGLAPIFLFGKERRDWRMDFIAGAIFNRVSFGGFSPLVRLLRTTSHADIVLWDYNRTRLDVGFTRTF